MGTSKIIYRMSQFPNGLRRRRWRRDRSATGTRRPGCRAGRTRREGAAAGSAPARLGSARSRQGPPGGVGQSAEGRRSPGRVSFPPSPRGGCASTAAVRVLRGGCTPVSGACPLPVFAQTMGESQTQEKPPRAEQQGQDSRPGPQTPGAEWPALGDGSSSALGSSEAPKERPCFHRVPHPALLNKTRRSKTHK